MKLEDGSYQFDIFWELYSLNVWEGMHFHKRSRLKKKLTEEISLCFGPKPDEPLQHVRVSFSMVRKRKITDYDNLRSVTKLPLDAMVRAGILLDDSMDNIGAPVVEQFTQAQMKTLASFGGRHEGREKLGIHTRVNIAFIN